MKHFIISITIITFFNINNALGQDFINLMQSGRTNYEKKNFLSAYEKFSQAFEIAISDDQKKDSESWKANSLKFLQKQYKEMGETIAELKKTKYVIETLYFYDNRIGLACKEHKYGFIDKEGEGVIPFIYDEASHFDPFSGFAKVSRNNIQFLIDTAGNEYPLATNPAAINGSNVALDLRNQQLSSIPMQVFNCINLKVLLLGNNQIYSVPSDISKLKNLVFLDLSNNKILNLPEEFGALINLKFLSLSGNQLGKLPEGFSQLQYLEELKLNNNNLFVLPKGFGNLHQLNYLNLEDNKLTSVPAEICRLYSLKVLMLQKNQIEKIAAEIGNLSIVENICLSENNIIDLPVSMERMRGLKNLNLARNRIGNVPVELKKLTGLKDFDLRGNRIPEEKKGMLKAWFPGCNIQM